MAHEVIQKHWGKHGLAQIIIIPKGNDYEGQSILQVPEGYIQNTIQNHAELIVELAYGCYIQTIYIGDGYRGFDYCFGNPSGHGRDDFMRYSSILNEFSSDKKQQIFELITQYFSEQFQNNATLRALLPSVINMENYLMPLENGYYSVNLSELRAGSTNFTQYIEDGLVHLIDYIRNILIT